MAVIRSHRDLVVWQKAMDLTVGVYGLARRLPRFETYGLVSQLTRAAASVPANIAEGHARGTRRDYAKFVAIGRGSLMETDTFLLLAVRLGYLPAHDVTSLRNKIEEVSKMLTGLRKRLLSPDTPQT
jgi:four helix bundle protein